MTIFDPFSFLTYTFFLSTSVFHYLELLIRNVKETQNHLKQQGFKVYPIVQLFRIWQKLHKPLINITA